MQKSRKNQIEKVSKPYLTGKIIDRATPGGALKFFGFMALMLFVYFMSIVVSSVESRFLTILINGAILFTTWLIFWQSGMTAGADAVSQGEIMFQRREKGRPVAPWEEEQCYHPLKGFAVAIIGSLPVVLCCVVLAIIAKRQMTGLGVLPGWVSAFESRPEIGPALSYYHQEAKLTLEAVLRIIDHMVIMPWISIIGTDNNDVTLLLERISPLLALIPVICYGVGYMMGTQERVAVHSNIALGKKKQQKKLQKERKARQKAAHRGPEQLN